MTKEEKRKSNIVTELARADEIAKRVFGDQASVSAVAEIYEQLEGAPDEGVKEFMADLTEAVENAKIAFKVSRPTPEQVFLVFNEFFNDEDEEEEEELPRRRAR